MRASILILLACAATPAVAAEYLVFGYARTKVEGQGCPVGKFDMKEMDSKEDTKAWLKDFLADESLTDKNPERIEKKRLALVYSYQGSAAVHPQCVFTKYGVVSGKDEADARRKLEQKVQEYRKYFLSEPAVLHVWQGEFLQR